MSYNQAEEIVIEEIAFWGIYYLRLGKETKKKSNI